MKRHLFNSTLSLLPKRGTLCEFLPVQDDPPYYLFTGALGEDRIEELRQYRLKNIKVQIARYNEAFHGRDLVKDPPFKIEQELTSEQYLNIQTLSSYLGSGPSSEASSVRSLRFTTTDTDPVSIYHDSPVAVGHSTPLIPPETRRDIGDVAETATSNLVRNAMQTLSEDDMFAGKVVDTLQYLMGRCYRLLYSDPKRSRGESTGDFCTGTAATPAGPPSQSLATFETASSSNATSSSSCSIPQLTRALKKRQLSPASSANTNRSRPKAARKHGDPKRALRWPCPYILAFDLMPCESRRFLACRLPSGLRQRDDVKRHLERIHCNNPEPGENDQYFMSPTQWKECKGVFEITSGSRQKEQSSEWYKAQTACYHRIWRVIFPIEAFPTTGMEPPTRPFDVTPPQFRSSLDQVKIIFCAFQYLDADRAVNIQHNLKQAFDLVAQFSSEENREYLRAIEEACMTAAVHDPALWLKDAFPNGSDKKGSIPLPEPHEQRQSQRQPLISMNGVASDAVWFSNILSTHPSYQPNHKLSMTVIPADDSPEPKYPPTSFVNCGESSNDQLAAGPTIPTNAPMKTPAMNPIASISSIPKEKQEWGAEADYPVTHLLGDGFLAGENWLGDCIVADTGIGTGWDFDTPVE